MTAFLAIASLAFGVSSASATLMFTFSDAGSGNTTVAILGSGTITASGDRYIAAYEGGGLDSFVGNGVNQQGFWDPPFARPNFGAPGLADYFLFADFDANGSGLAMRFTQVSTSGSLNLASLNGTYVVPVDFSNFIPGTYNLGVVNSATDVFPTGPIDIVVNAPSSSVPDAGATASLFGLALFGLAALRRKLA